MRTLRKQTATGNTFPIARLMCVESTRIVYRMRSGFFLSFPTVASASHPGLAAALSPVPLASHFLQKDPFHLEAKEVTSPPPPMSL